MTTTPADPPLPVFLLEFEGTIINNALYRSRYQADEAAQALSVRVVEYVPLAALEAERAEHATTREMCKTNQVALHKLQTHAAVSARSRAGRSVATLADCALEALAELEAERDALAAKLEAIENLAADALCDDFEHTADAYVRQMVDVLAACADRCPECPKYLNKCPRCHRVKDRDGRRLEAAGKEGK